MTRRGDFERNFGIGVSRRRGKPSSSNASDDGLRALRAVIVVSSLLVCAAFAAAVLWIWSAVS